MDSDALLTFLSVHRHGSVSAAAEALSRTQSAISRRIAVLEARVGLPLFERVGRRMVLSDAGLALLPQAERVASALRDAEAAIEAVRSGGGGLLRIAVVGTLADARLAGALQAVRKACPQLDVRLRTATSDEVSALVRSGDATLGLRYFEDRADDLDAKVVLQEPLVVACAPSHPLARRRVASLARLADQRWLTFPVLERREESFARSVFAQFQARGVDRIDWTAIDSLTAQKRLVEAGLGLALLQAGAIEEELAAGRLARIEVADLSAAVPVVRVLRRGVFLGEGAQAFLRAIEAAPAPAYFSQPRRRK